MENTNLIVSYINKLVFTHYTGHVFWKKPKWMNSTLSSYLNRWMIGLVHAPIHIHIAFKSWHRTSPPVRVRALNNDYQYFAPPKFIIIENTAI